MDSLGMLLTFVSKLESLTTRFNCLPFLFSDLLIFFLIQALGFAQGLRKL